MTNTTANRPDIPPGFRLKADGSYVPEALVSDIDKLRDQTIETLIDQAKIISTLLADFKGPGISRYRGICRDERRAVRREVA